MLRGGRSSEHDVSLSSGESVAEGLRAAGHETVDVVIDREGRWTCEGEPISLVPASGLAGADVAFPVIHGPYGEDGVVQGVLEALDLPYVGPGVLGAATTLDKLTCKRLLAERGLPQVGFVEAAGEGWREAARALGTPVWVKPSRLGSSVGISRVDDPAELDDAVEAARRHDPRVIVEAHAEAREVECSVMGNSEVRVSVPGEILIEADWYDYEAKYEPGGMRLQAPAELAPEASERVRLLAEQAYRALGLSGLARCDFFVAEGGEVLVNELNTIPGFTRTSVFARLFEASGIPYPELMDGLVGLARERYAEERRHAF